jgi:protocatechuate 3,4-dioxygenase beta subunit
MRWNHVSRRRIIQGMALAATVSELGATDLQVPTEALGLGPFYKPGAPERQSLREKGMAGDPLLVSGKVLDTRGRPIAGARIEMWHVDSKGEYDKEGFRLRGQISCSASGDYRFETMTPVAYGNRCAHVHVRVSAAGAKTLETEIQFDGDPVAAKDRGARAGLAMKTTTQNGERQGSFLFVLRNA